MPTDLKLRQHVLEFDWSPNITPALRGQHWIDRISKREWFSVGTASVSDWHERTAGGSSSPVRVDRILNVAAFAGYTPTQPNAVVETLGYYDLGDGGHASYYIDENDTTTPSDGGSVFVIAGGRRAKLRYGGAVSVKRFGARGLSAAQDTAAFQAWLAYIGDTKAGYVPRGNYLINATLNPLAHAKIYFDKAVLKSSVANGACLRLHSGTKLTGILVIDCLNTTGAVGLQLGHGQHCQHCEIDSVWVYNAATGVQLRSNALITEGIHMNRFGKVHCLDCGIGLHFWSNYVGSHEVNANRFDLVSCQRCTVTPLKMEGGDGNSLGFYEAELNTGGFAIDLIRCLGFSMDGGWVEGNTVGNLRIANDPDVKGVYIRGTFDTLLNAADAKFSYTHANTRSVHIFRHDYALLHGITRIAGQMLVGTDGTTGNDQSVIRLEVASGMDVYRYSAGQPHFYMRGQANTGFLFSVNAGTTALQLDSNGQATFPLQANFTQDLAPAVGKGLAWDSGTEFVRRAAATDAIEIGVSSTVFATYDATGNLVLASGDVRQATGKGLSWDSNSEFLRRTAAEDAVEIGVNTQVIAKFDGSVTANDTRFLLWDVTGNTLKRVVLGAADSGGVGWKMLRVAN